MQEYIGVGTRGVILCYIKHYTYIYKYVGTYARRGTIRLIGTGFPPVAVAYPPSRQSAQPSSSSPDVATTIYLLKTKKVKMLTSRVVSGT